MRRNDFFKSLLFSGGSAASRSELETETLPYTFVSKSQRLKDYRIYGNTVDGESVGDLVTEGDHAGEYLVPVTVEGKNLANNNHTTSTTNYTITESDNYIHVVGTNNTNNNQAVVLSRSVELDSGNYDLVNNSTTEIGFDYRDENNINVWALVPANSTKTFIYPSNVVRALNIYKTVPAGDSIDEYFQVMIVRHGDSITPYEPYHAPVTTNLYLPEQIKMVGDEAEYIDFREQKQHFADGTSADVTLPAIPILSGTNTLSVGTTVQPSKVYLQGKISEAETVSARSLQTNMQSLQPLSLDDEDLELDVMPTDNDLQIDVKPIEKPVLNLNDVSEIENAEIERGVESAE